MKQRGITRDEVIRTLETSVKTMTDNLGHSIAQLSMNGRVLRVFFVERDGKTIVITAYISSKVKYRTE
ncbi:MAG: DUF4258 domain-containing protein [Candidatus Thorarchaeota archaeon]